MGEPIETNLFNVSRDSDSRKVIIDKITNRKEIIEHNGRGNVENVDAKYIMWYNTYNV